MKKIKTALMHAGSIRITYINTMYMHKYIPLSNIIKNVHYKRIKTK